MVGSEFTPFLVKMWNKVVTLKTALLYLVMRSNECEFFLTMNLHDDLTQSHRPYRVIVGFKTGLAMIRYLSYLK